MMRKYFTKEIGIRCLVCVTAVIFVGLGTAILRLSCMGTDPFSAMNYAVSEVSGLPLGTVMMIVSACMMVLCAVFMRNAIGFGMAANMFLLGTSADFWLHIIRNVTGLDGNFIGTQHLLFRLVLVVFGILCIVFFNSFVLAANVGISAYDALGYIIEKLTAGKLPFKTARILTDLFCVCTALLLTLRGGKPWEIIGIGTAAMAVGTGPLLTFMKQRVAEPVMYAIGK